MAAQTLEAGAPRQDASETTTRLVLPTEHADAFRAWLLNAASRANRAGGHTKAAAFKRVWEAMGS